MKKKTYARPIIVGLLGALASVWWAVTQPISGEQGSPAASDAPARLEAHVRMLSETFSPRDYRNVDNLNKAAGYIASQLAATGASISEQPFMAEGRNFKNIIARFGPKDGARIVVGAHYDTCDPLPGADDNASGVAGLIELARMLAATPVNVPVELVAYTLEEPPFFRTDNMGSAVHARSLRKANVEVRAMISIEMIGYFSDAPGSQQLPSFILKPFYPSVGNFIAVIGDLNSFGLTRKVKRAMKGASSLPVYSLNGPQFIPGVDFSDHVSYWDQDYPALMVTDTAFFRNLAYHTAEDTADRLDYKKMANVVVGIDAAVRMLAK